MLVWHVQLHGLPGGALTVAFTPRGLCYHHSATPDSGSASWGAIRHHHTIVNGWRDIGYHFGVERIDDGAGRRHAEILMGRSLLTAGAHAPAVNATHVGVCVVGNYDAIVPPDDLWNAAVRLGVTLCVLLRLNPALPGVILGHRDVQAKSCPGLLFDVSRLRASIVQHMP